MGAPGERDDAMTSQGDVLYEEKLSSAWTTALFVVLTLVFGALAAWRWTASAISGSTVAFALLALMFLFYVVNYRVLTIQINANALVLRFGIFTNTVSLDNVETCERDHVPTGMYYGGAGIHWMSVSGRYRASYNFLEHPRVVVALREKRGRVRDVSFTTRRPDEVLAALEKARA